MGGGGTGRQDKGTGVCRCDWDSVAERGKKGKRMPAGPEAVKEEQDKAFLAKAKGQLTRVNHNGTRREGAAEENTTDKRG